MPIAVKLMEIRIIQTPNDPWQTPVLIYATHAFALIQPKANHDRTMIFHMGLQCLRIYQSCTWELWFRHRRIRPFCAPVHFISQRLAANQAGNLRLCLHCDVLVSALANVIFMRTLSLWVGAKRWKPSYLVQHIGMRGALLPFWCSRLKSSLSKSAIEKE